MTKQCAFVICVTVFSIIACSEPPSTQPILEQKKVDYDNTEGASQAGGVVAR